MVSSDLKTTVCQRTKYQNLSHVFYPLFLGVPTNESPESKTCSSAKVSGLQRSQEQSNSEVPFTPPVPSPTPASAPTGSPAPAAAAAPLEPPSSRVPTPPPVSVKREQHPPPPVPTPPLLRAPPHPQPHPSHPHSHQETRTLPPPQHHARPIISHQVHHPLYSSLHDIRLVLPQRLGGWGVQESQTGFSNIWQNHAQKLCFRKALNIKCQNKESCRRVYSTFMDHVYKCASFVATCSL